MWDTGPVCPPTSTHSFPVVCVFVFGFAVFGFGKNVQDWSKMHRTLCPVCARGRRKLDCPLLKSA